jgi:hypothetical protein
MASLFCYLLATSENMGLCKAIGSYFVKLETNFCVNDIIIFELNTKEEVMQI